MKIFPRFNINSVLKIFLTILSVFIVWSILAIITNIINPFPEIRLVYLGSGESTSLAQSIFSDILNSYFSFFSITVLCFFSLSLNLGFKLSDSFFREFFSIKLHGKPLKAFLYKLFLNSHIEPINLVSMEKINFFVKSGSHVIGPAQINLRAGFAALIKIRGGENRILLSKGNHYLEISAEEKLIDIYNFNDSQITIQINNPQLFQDKRSIEVKYKILPDLRSSTTNAKFGNVLEYLDSKNLYDIIDSIILLEFQSLQKLMEKLHFSSAKITGESTNKKQIDNTGFFHNLSLPLNNISKKRLNIERNRKRRLYTHPSKISPVIESDSVEVENRAVIEKFKSLLTTQIRETVMQLFGIELFKIVGFQIGGKH